LSRQDGNCSSCCNSTGKLTPNAKKQALHIPQITEARQFICNNTLGSSLAGKPDVGDAYKLQSWARRAPEVTGFYLLQYDIKKLC
jgi:hypothetical protein